MEKLTPWDYLSRSLIQLPPDAKFTYEKLKTLVEKYRAEVAFLEEDKYTLRVKPNRKNQDIGLELHLIGFRLDAFSEVFNYEWNKPDNNKELEELINFFHSKRQEEETKEYLKKKINLFINEANLSHPGVLFLFLKASKLGIVQLDDLKLSWYGSLVKAVQKGSISAAIELQSDECISLGLRYFFRIVCQRLEKEYKKEKDKLGCLLNIRLSETDDDNPGDFIFTKIKNQNKIYFENISDKFIKNGELPQVVSEWIKKEDRNWYYPCIFCADEVEAEQYLYEHLKSAHSLNVHLPSEKNKFPNKTFLDIVNPSDDFSAIWYGAPHFLKKSNDFDLTIIDQFVRLYELEFK